MRALREMIEQFRALDEGAARLARQNRAEVKRAHKAMSAGQIPSFRDNMLGSSAKATFKSRFSQARKSKVADPVSVASSAAPIRRPR